MDRISIKLKYLAVIRAYRKLIDNVEYFKYRSIEFYKLRSKEKFIELIENGKIIFNFKVDSFTSLEHYGGMDSHGVDFSISYEDLEELFEMLSLK